MNEIVHTAKVIQLAETTLPVFGNQVEWLCSRYYC
jgi:hypothetical protein